MQQEIAENTATICDTLRPHVDLSEAPPSPKTPIFPHASSSSQVPGLVERRTGDSVAPLHVADARNLADALDVLGVA